MTKEQIEKKAKQYALLVCTSEEHIMYDCAIKDWKAGYHFRDKEVEELKAENKKFRDLIYRRVNHIEIDPEPPLVP